MRVLKLAVSRRRSYQEIADMFNIKMQAICDLVKNSKQSQCYFIKKREKEVRSIVQQVAIAGAVQTSINRK